MGENGVGNFKNAIKHLKAKEYNKAAEQLLYNYDGKGVRKGWTNWHKQTPDRANEKADTLSRLKIQ